MSLFEIQSSVLVHVFFGVMGKKAAIALHV